MKKKKERNDKKKEKLYRPVLGFSLQGTYTLGIYPLHRVPRILFCVHSLCSFLGVFAIRPNHSEATNFTSPPPKLTLLSLTTVGAPSSSFLPCILAVDGRLRLAGSYIVAETAAVAERVQAVSHYGNPAAGCESDEQSYQVSGVDGSFCSPKCSSDNACPHDYPSGKSPSFQHPPHLYVFCYIVRLVESGRLSKLEDIAMEDLMEERHCHVQSDAPCFACICTHTCTCTTRGRHVVGWAYARVCACFDWAARICVIMI